MHPIYKIAHLYLRVTDKYSIYITHRSGARGDTHLLRRYSPNNCTCIQFRTPPTQQAEGEEPKYEINDKIYKYRLTHFPEKCVHDKHQVHYHWVFRSVLRLYTRLTHVSK